MPIVENIIIISNILISNIIPWFKAKNMIL